MALKKKYGTALPVQLEPAWRDRIQAVADHPQVETSLAEVIRNCIALALPPIELELGLVDLDDLDDEALARLGLERQEEPATPTAPPGCWGGAM